jgi:hypothetical protein
MKAGDRVITEFGPGMIARKTSYGEYFVALDTLDLLLKEGSTLNGLRIFHKSFGGLYFLEDELNVEAVG